MNTTITHSTQTKKPNRQRDPQRHGTQGKLKRWHSPLNEDCPWEDDESQDCTCKRRVNRKPYRVIRIHEREPARGVSDYMVLCVWPDGRMELREHGRRAGSGFTVMASHVYAGAAFAQAMKRAREKAAAKKAAKAAKRVRRG